VLETGAFSVLQGPADELAVDPRVIETYLGAASLMAARSFSLMPMLGARGLRTAGFLDIINSVVNMY
jgi:hypothetical protein